jgi:hypothetical protein
MHDTECPAGDVCDTTQSQCITNAPTDGGVTLCVEAPKDGGGPPGKCSVNADDMCCSEATGCVANPWLDAGAPMKPAALPTAYACCPGSAGDIYCQGKVADPTATCATVNPNQSLCSTCMHLCIWQNPAAYERFVGYQLTECGCTANGACYAACRTSTTLAGTSACGTCLASQVAEGLASECTLAAAADCSNDPACTAFQMCAGMCPM